MITVKHFTGDVETFDLNNPIRMRSAWDFHQFVSEIAYSIYQSNWQVQQDLNNKAYYEKLQQLMKRMKRLLVDIQRQIKLTKVLIRTYKDNQVSVVFRQYDSDTIEEVWQPVLYDIFNDDRAEWPMVDYRPILNRNGFKERLRLLKEIVNTLQHMIGCHAIHMQNIRRGGLND